MPWKRNGNPLQDSCQENPMDRGDWRAASMRSQSRAQLKRLRTYAGWDKHEERSLKPGDVCAQALLSCLTLCDPVDHCPPGSSVHGLSQARILEWVAIPFSRGSSWLRVWTCVSCPGRQILYHLSHQGSPLSEVMLKSRRVENVILERKKNLRRQDF